MKHKKEVRTQLYRLGKTVGLEKGEIDRAKKTVMSRIPLGAIAVVFAFIGNLSVDYTISICPYTVSST